MAQRISFDDEIQRNKLKSFFLIVFIFAIFLILGYVISLILDPSYFFIIMIIAIIFSIGYVLISYYNSDKIALASVRAKPASRTDQKVFFDVVEDMSLASGLPMPRLFVMETDEINAFASGRDPKHAVICVTTGALKKLNKQELEGVVSHEMSHIANYDVRFMTLTAVMIGMVSIIAQIFLRSLWFSNVKGDKNSGQIEIALVLIGIIFAILAPIAAQLVSLAISRKREFAADASGVKFTRYPTGLVNALKKIKEDETPEKGRRVPIAKAMAPLFISDPFKRKVKSLLSTHPDINERIRRLEDM